MVSRNAGGEILGRLDAARGRLDRIARYRDRRARTPGFASNKSSLAKTLMAGSGDRTSISFTSAVTVTVSVRAARLVKRSASAAFSLSPTCSVLLISANPGATAVNSYSPGETTGKTKRPSESVLDSNAVALETILRLSLAADTGLPCVSVRRPATRTSAAKADQIVAQSRGAMASRCRIILSQVLRKFTIVLLIVARAFER